LNKLETLYDRLPESWEALDTIKSLAAHERAEHRIYSIDRLQELLSPITVRNLTTLVSELEKNRLICKRYQVNSEIAGTLDEFDSLDDIPPKIMDPIVGEIVEVNYDLISIAYRIKKTN